MVAKKMEESASQLCKKLCAELEAAAEIGDLDGVTRLLSEYKDNPQKYDPYIFDILVGNAYWRSCENGHLECVKMLQPVSGKTDMFHAIMGACNYGQQKVLEFLLSVYKWKNASIKKDALLCAVSSGSIEMVKYVLTHVTHKPHRNEALCEASIKQNREIFDLLYPLSNPQSALNSMDKNPETTDDDKQMLRNEIAYRQNLAIREAIGKTAGSPALKNKM